MSGELVSLRMLLVAAAGPRQELWREGAGLASVPIDFAAEDAAAARATLAKGGVEICVVDAALTAADKVAVIKAARTKEPAPLVFVSAPRGGARPDNIDGALMKPANSDDARKLVEICIRVKIPTRVLIVDDSEPTRSVVRKILTASRFSMDIHDASESTAALDQLRTGKFEIVFLDSSMPGIDGVDLLLEIKRANPKVAVVIMNSTRGNGGADRSKLSDAHGSLKKPFYPADVDALLERYYGLHAPG